MFCHLILVGIKEECQEPRLFASLLVSPGITTHDENVVQICNRILFRCKKCYKFVD